MAGATGRANRVARLVRDPHTGEMLGFATLERLFAFLEDQTGMSDAEKPVPSKP